ncbi:WD repeat-containing protein 35 isoform X2 [Agrilus planipennis]|nr:WD repeat-containing protein 35 isoform X2 [Agrilus planipennis]
MDWSSDGLKICIVYEDGAVIVGSVDGNRIWGKELKGIHLSGVQWSPDGKLLLLSTKNGQLHLYDYQGNFVMPIEVYCQADLLSETPVVSLDWYNGKNGILRDSCAVLAICFINGRIQLMINESDTNPTIINTQMFSTHCSWNHNGSLLAVSGRQHENNKESNVVQFYSPFGDHLRTLKVPGNSISCCVWEKRSLRVALAIDSFIYFANIRPDYKWCYFKKTVVYTYNNREGICVTFWDTVNNHYHTKSIPNLLALAAFGDYCVLATINESENSKENKYNLLLCNTLGTPVDGKNVVIEPQWIAMNSSYVIAASKDNFLMWQYKTPRSLSSARNRCKMYHIDDTPSGAIEIIQELEQPVNISVNTYITKDPICCLTASNKSLIIGRESGTLQHYALPHTALVNKYKLSSKPHKLRLNCNSTRLSVIDISGILIVLDISDDNINTYQNGKLERKDVWAMCWASDNPQLLSVMEKTRMYIFKGVHPEEPIACAGYICSFNDLEIQAVLLDEIIEAPEKPNGNHIIKLEVKSLRDTRQLLEKVGITETIQFIEDNPHPRLWKLLGEAALKDLNLTTAESAFVRSRNYSGIQLVKKLQTINGNAIKKAYVEAYLENFEEAERLFIEADRRDLALSLRQTLGDWFRVIQIMKNGVTAPDLLLETAYNSAADYFVHNNNWAAAAEYYELSKNISGLIECHFHLENLDALEKLIDKLPEKDALLKRLSDIFASNAVIGPAVKCLLKIGDAKSAVDLCISHNNWDQAIHLATQYRLPEIANIFKTYSAHLVDQNQLLKAVEVNKQTNFYFTAAVHATKLAQNEINKSNRNLLDIKKLFVYSALLMELSKTKSAEEEVLNSDSDMLLVDSAWRGAEAYHLLILIHEHLYANKIHNATITAFKLQEYCDIIPPQEVYSILALVSCLDNEFGLCSNAFTKLQTLPNITKAEKEAYDKLAVDIFTAQDPVDLKTYTLKCYNCEVPVIDWCTSCSNCNANFPSCMVSGCPLINNVEDKWSCNVCHHVAKSVYANFRKSCPLCHTSIERNSSNYK